MAMERRSMWDQAAEMANQSGKGGRFVKLQNDGDKVDVVFLGEPFPLEVCFVNGRYVRFTEELKSQGHKSSLRVAFNVALVDSKEVKILEISVVLFKDVLQVREKYGLDRWSFEVRRRGAANDPKTTYTILPDRQLTPEQQKEFQALPLHDLESFFAETASETNRTNGALGASSSKPNGGAVAVKTTQSIAVILRSLPMEAASRFCKKFGIERIKDLPSERGDDSISYLDELEAEFRVLQEPKPEVDPFA